MRCLPLMAAGAMILAGVSQAFAGTNLVQNGSFEMSAFGGASTELSNGVDWIAPGASATNPSGVNGWTVGTYANASGAADVPYILWWNAANATSVDAISQWTAAEPQRLDAAFGGPSPDGGFFIGMDGDQGSASGGNAANGTLSQAINGLVAGATYKLTFDWAAIQLSNRSGDTTDQMLVRFGGASFTTPATPVNLASQGFSGWLHASTTFTATAGMELLSFLDLGTPNGLPPMALLDGVSLTKAPEPAGAAVLGTGLLVLAGITARRRTRS